jgi:hypothetical protein
MHIGGEGVENLLVNMVLKKGFFLKDANWKRHLLMPLYFAMG